MEAPSILIVLNSSSVIAPPCNNALALFKPLNALTGTKSAVASCSGAAAAMLLTHCSKQAKCSSETPFEPTGILVAHCVPELGSTSFNKKELLGLLTSMTFSPAQLALIESTSAKRAAICSTVPVKEIFAAWLGVALWQPAAVQLSSAITACMSAQSTGVGDEALLEWELLESELLESAVLDFALELNITSDDEPSGDELALLSTPVHADSIGSATSVSLKKLFASKKFNRDKELFIVCLGRLGRS